MKEALSICTMREDACFNRDNGYEVYLTVGLLCLICVELDKTTAFKYLAVICLPRSLSVHTGDRTRSHKTIANILCRLAIVA